MNSIFLQGLLLALELSSNSAMPPRYKAPQPVIQAFKTTHPIKWHKGISIAEDLENPKKQYAIIPDFSAEDFKNPSDQVAYATLGDITILNNKTFIYKIKSIALRHGRLVYSGQVIKLIDQNLIEPENYNFYYYTKSHSERVYRYSYSYNTSYYHYSHYKGGISYFDIIPAEYTGDKHQAVCYEASYRLNDYGNWHPSILVIYTEKTATAYRFDGYGNYEYGGCRTMRTDGKGIFLISRIQITKSTPFDHLNDPPHSLSSVHKRLVWYICTMDGCQSYIDPRPVYPGVLSHGKITNWRTVPGEPPVIYDDPPLIGDWRATQEAGPLILDWFNSPICKFSRTLHILSSIC